MSDPVRFLLDEHVPAAVAAALRRRGVNAITAQEAGGTGLADREQLARATDDLRVVVTFDDDFLVLAAQLHDHAGVAFCPATRYSIGELIRVLLLLHEVLDREEMRNHVEFL